MAEAQALKTQRVNPRHDLFRSRRVLELPEPWRIGEAIVSNGYFQPTAGVLTDEPERCCPLQCPQLLDDFGAKVRRLRGALDHGFPIRRTLHKVGQHAPSVGIVDFRCLDPRLSRPVLGQSFANKSALQPMSFASSAKNQLPVVVVLVQQPVNIQRAVTDPPLHRDPKPAPRTPLGDSSFFRWQLGTGVTQGYFTSMRWRTIILVLVILIGLPVYIWAAMAALSLIPAGWPVLIKTPFYLIAGILWAFFLPPLFKWSAKDPNSQFEPK